MNMFQRARYSLPLSPAERSLLKFLQGSVASLLAAGLVAALPALEQQSVDWRTVITVGAGAIFVTGAQALSKYFTAHGDPVLGTLVGDAGSSVQKVIPIAPAQAPVVSATPAPAVSNI